jgi:tRNA(Leu) C34 or U34 (ribose-2'-O)-methylase TrmL
MNLLELVQMCVPKKAKQRNKKELEEHGIDYYDTTRVVVYQECQKFIKA